MEPTYCERWVEVERSTVGTQSFHFVAARETPVEVRLRKPRRRHPAFTRRLRIAILGSRELDARDIDPGSLRLGAERLPASRSGRRARLRDVNRDGIRDVVVRFPNPGVALTDERLCLQGATYHGPALAGCAAFEPHHSDESDSDSRDHRRRRRSLRGR